MEKRKDIWSYKEGILQCLIMMNSWKIISGQLHYSIPEEVHKGSFVGNVVKDLGIDGKQPFDHGLRIIPNSGTIQYFELNSNSGHLQTCERIDREEICGRGEKCILKFQILAESKLKLYVTEIEIMDINDNAPSFLSIGWELKISETSIPGSQFFLPEAQDPDLGTNSIQRYQLTASNHFSLEVQSSHNGVKSAKLVLERSLDREEQSVYDLILTAVDGGEPIKSGTLQIHIFVLDANDNVPVFSQSVYEINVKENMPKGSTIATVTAIDLDEGINGEIKYSFQKITKKDSQKFMLNSTSGEIILVGSLDFETSSSYEFEVQAMDGGGLSDRSKVVILVTDLNDNAPDLAIAFVINSVPENSPAGTVIAILNARDRDSGDNGEVECSIPSNLPFRLKKTMDSFYSLETDRALDREQLPTYTITVTAVDGGTPPLSTSVVISLQVFDTNDNPPQFVESKYTSYLLENNPKGASAFSLKASDPDWEENARITYSFEAVCANPMDIFYITVEIQDINDNAPHFLNGDIKLEISESTLPGATFLLGQAEDPDIGTNSLQDYHLSINQYFILAISNQDTVKKYAELILEKQLDRESESTISLTLMALDGGNPPRTGTAKIRIRVMDANDNPPVFSQKVYKISLKESVSKGSTVIQVKAVDRDDGSNGQINYSFSNIADNVYQKFDLDPYDGIIIVKEELDFEETDKYAMVVEARDGGGLVAHCNVEINLVDANDNTPEVIIASSSREIPENSELGTLVALININDKDSGDNGEVNCQLQNTSPFKIVSASNNYYKLLTDGPLDRESIPAYNLTNTATDKGSPPLSTLKTISLEISDINDNAPAFEKSSYTVYVPENNPASSSIFSIKAVDPDLGHNARITYSILTSKIEELPLPSYLSVNSETGTLYSQRSFDYEQLREFQVQVKAEDGGSPPLSSNATLKVFILDQNDQSPQILYPSQGAEGSASFEMVPRSAEVGYLVTKVVAVDADSGHNAWLSYHLLQATEPGLFTIAAHTGEIRTLRTFLERDALKQKLVVLVKDNGQPPLSATVSLNLVFAENFQEALPEISNQTTDSPPNYEEGTIPYSYQLCLSSESKIHEFTFPAPKIQAAEYISCNQKSDVLLASNENNILNSEMDRINLGVGVSQRGRQGEWSRATVQMLPKE
ncbi:protocadherin gamma-B1-like [Python bivittatus]|uniref:Protocadherin gamma-B1-like n=1 Tax=Python bivittatus TaxID=176946 RepID=A0A9F5IYU5_PYTBI|nr:protocadherin gamma-B1-like [Python bivittatus]